MKPEINLTLGAWVEWRVGKQGKVAVNSSTAETWEMCGKGLPNQWKQACFSSPPPAPPPPPAAELQPSCTASSSQSSQPSSTKCPLPRSCMARAYPTGPVLAFLRARPASSPLPRPLVLCALVSAPRLWSPEGSCTLFLSVYPSPHVWLLTA